MVWLDVLLLALLGAHRDYIRFHRAPSELRRFYFYVWGATVPHVQAWPVGLWDEAR